MSHTYSVISEDNGNYRKIYVYHPKGDSKTCIIHGHGSSSDECEVMGDFGSKYVKRIPTKDCGHNHVSRKRFNRRQENNDIVNSAVDEILLHKN